jgi:hypothetical protein
LSRIYYQQFNAASKKVLLLRERAKFPPALPEAQNRHRHSQNYVETAEIPNNQLEESVSPKSQFGLQIPDLS